VKRSLGFLPVFAVALIILSSCRSTYYAAYEKFGVYKRDLLKKRVVAARDEQKEATVEFKDALTRLKDITQFEGGKLETHYRQLQSDYDDCSKRVETVHKRIRDVETVAEDLFAEWEKEIKQISTDSLRANSRRQLSDTRARYEEMITALKKAESTMPPVLVKFHDYVLALKHTLNAQAVASLKGESASIQAEITRLISEMNASIARADEFLKDFK
jgi:predicted  nucleic acid-binding Zn-ribbon protein